MEKRKNITKRGIIIRRIQKTINVIIASGIGVIACLSITCLIMQKTPEELYISFRTRPDNVKIISYVDDSSYSTPHYNNQIDAFEENAEEIMSEDNYDDSTSFITPNGNTLPTPAKDEYENETYLKRGIIEYYSLYDQDSPEAIVYSELQNAALHGKYFEDYDYYDQSEWLGGYEELSKFAISPNDISNIMDDITYDYPILSLYRTGEGNIKSSVDDCGYYAITTPANEEENIDFSELYEQVENKASLINEKAIDASEGKLKKYINAVYKYICENISYSNDVNDTIHANDIYGALCEKESKCYGVACAFKYVLDKQNIPNFIATGDAPENQKHAWNMVWFHNSWRVCDLTIGETSSNGQPGSVDKIAKVSDEIPDRYNGCLMDYRSYYITYDIHINEHSKQIQKMYEQEQNKTTPIS